MMKILYIAAAIVLTTGLVTGVLLYGKPIPRVEGAGTTIVPDPFLYAYEFPKLSSPDTLLDAGDAFKQTDGTWYVHLVATSSDDYYGPLPKGMTISQFTVVTATGGSNAIAVFRNQSGTTTRSMMTTASYSSLTPVTVPTNMEQTSTL